MLSMPAMIRTYIRLLLMFAAVTTLASTIGCQSPDAAMSGYNARHLASVETAQVFTVTRHVLEGYGFAIRRADIDRGWMVTQPARAHELEAAAIRDILGREADERRVVTMRVLPESAGATVYCKVEVQQPYSDEFSLYSDAHKPSDTLSDTPIDRDAATTDEQNTVWRTRRRDRDLERSLLDAVVQAVSGDAVPQPPGS